MCKKIVIYGCVAGGGYCLYKHRFQVWYLIVSIPDLCTLTYLGIDRDRVSFPADLSC